MKHLHMLMALMTLAIFGYQFVQIFLGKSGQLPKLGKIIAHVIYTILLIAGVVVLMPIIKLVGLPHFILAKVVLFVVAISATIKATRQNTANHQAKMGMLISLVAYVGIVILAFTKPMNLF